MIVQKYYTLFPIADTSIVVHDPVLVSLSMHTFVCYCYVH